MTTPSIVQVAEAVRAGLTAAAVDATRFGQTFTAERVYVQSLSVGQGDFSSLRVTVMPRVSETDIIGRDETAKSVQVDVAVRAKMAEQSDGTYAIADADALLTLAEKIADFYNPPSYKLVLGDGVGEARCTQSSHRSIYSYSHMIQTGLFFSIVTFTFRVLRED